MTNSNLEIIQDFIFGGNTGSHREKTRTLTKIIVAVASQKNSSDISKYLSAAMLNVSEEGICIEAQEFFGLNDNIYININLPNGQQISSFR